ncbi:MAG: dihydrofolate reductase [Proteiniphilum sp.]
MSRKQQTTIALIAALDEENAIGRNGGLLCHLPNDLKHFKQITTGHTVIMGRKTYESLPKGALPNRINIVITSDHAENYPGCIIVRSVEEALTHCKEDEKAFIIGGGKLYHSSLHLADQLYLTRIHHTFPDADTFFPEIDFGEWKLIDIEPHEADEKHHFAYSFLTYTKK